MLFVQCQIGGYKVTLIRTPVYLLLHASIQLTNHVAAAQAIKKTEQLKIACFSEFVPVVAHPPQGLLCCAV